MSIIQETKELSAGVYQVYKRPGETPLEATERMRRELSLSPEMSLTYAGRLDPLAEGLLIILSGDAIARKEEYLALPKTYKVEVLWGFGTDTGDVLGMCEEGGVVMEDRQEKIQEYIQNISGTTFSQKYPAYSSKPVDGKPLFAHAREGSEPEVFHDVTLHSGKCVGEREIDVEKLHEEIIEKISRVSGDFRQKEILARWAETLKNKTGVVVLDTFELTVSSGFYVRQFAADFGEYFGIKALAFSIIRTVVGDYFI